MAPTVTPGISGQTLGNIPQQWSAVWFRQFCLNHLQYADARNAVAGANVSISGGIGVPATFAAGVTSIANDTVLGNVSGIPAAPVGLTQAELTALVEEATTGLPGACPVLSGNSAQFLNGVGAFAAPPAVPIGANPSASIGLAVVDGSATTFMRSDGAPALSQAITPTWTGAHAFSSTVAMSANPLTTSTTRAQTGLAGVKTTPTTANSATPAADTSFTLTLNEAGWYNFEAYMPCYEATTGTGGFYMDFNTGTATLGTFVFSYEAYATAAQTSAAQVAATGAVGLSTISTSSTSPSWVLVKGVMYVTTGGTRGIRWAQNSLLSADPTTLMAGAYFKATKIG